MPLHLLGKKSWNVYNPTNIARVRQDEAKAAAEAEAADQRMQEEDSVRRIASLRGEVPPPITCDVATDKEGSVSRKRLPSVDFSLENDRILAKKRRKLRGEDDTDRDIRVAREDHDGATVVRDRLQKQQPSYNLTDTKGHIQLFEDQDDKTLNSKGSEKIVGRTPSNSENLTVGMKFSDASGFNVDPSGPWYASNVTNRAPINRVNAFGKPDPERADRDQRRVILNDPMAMMKKAQQQLKKASQEKLDWESAQESRVRSLDRNLARKEEHGNRRRRRRSDSLEDFSLDGLNTQSEKNMKESRHQHYDRKCRSPNSSSQRRRRSRSPRHRTHDYQSR